MDVDGSGAISIEEFYAAASKTGSNITENQVEEICKEVDLDQDGKVDFEGSKKVLERVRVFFYFHLISN